MVNMKKGNLSRGFTLIELLVVIAIIGLLAAVVLASVGGARNKGADASVKTQLNSARAQAELFADRNRTYDGVCAATQANLGLTSILANANAAIAGGAVTVDSIQTEGDVTCNDGATAWAISAPVNYNAAGTLATGQNWCVDSSGNSMTTATELGAAADYICN